MTVISWLEGLKIKCWQRIESSRLLQKMRFLCFSSRGNISSKGCIAFDQIQQEGNMGAGTGCAEKPQLRSHPLGKHWPPNSVHALIRHRPILMSVKMQGERTSHILDKAGEDVETLNLLCRVCFPSSSHSPGFTTILGCAVCC